MRKSNFNIKNCLIIKLPRKSTAIKVNAGMSPTEGLKSPQGTIAS